MKSNIGGWSRGIGLALVFSLSAAIDTLGQPSPVQSAARPLGLTIVGPVMAGASDAASADFQGRVLGSINQLLSVQLSEYKKVNDTVFLLDPSRLSLRTESDIRVYFVGEGAGYRNSLGYAITPEGQVVGDKKLIFPDASSSITYMSPGKPGVRSSSMPLLPGDYVDLPSASAGSMLDFFLIADGANGGRSVYSTVAARNPDRINHVVAFALPDSPYLILGFEDLLNGGDRDFNDVLVAVDIGARNVKALTGAPEPALIMVLGGFLALALRQRARASSAGRGSPA